MKKTVLMRIRALPERNCIAVMHSPAAARLCDWKSRRAKSKQCAPTESRKTRKTEGVYKRAEHPISSKVSDAPLVYMRGEYTRSDSSCAIIAGTRGICRSDCQDGFDGKEFNRPKYQKLFQKLKKAIILMGKRQ